VGTNVTKIRYANPREGQVSALTPTHAVVYWPDRNEQTYVKLDRFNRAREWKF